MDATTQGHPYAFKLTIDIPEQPIRLIDPIADDILADHGVKTTGVLTCTYSGIVMVPDWVTPEQVRQHVVNEAAREHVGTTVTITHWEMVPAEREADR